MLCNAHISCDTGRLIFFVDNLIWIAYIDCIGISIPISDYQKLTKARPKGANYKKNTKIHPQLLPEGGSSEEARMAFEKAWFLKQSEVEDRNIYVPGKMLPDSKQ